MRPVFLAGGVNRHDVGVMQLGGRLGLAVKTLHRLGGQTQPATQHLERDPAVKRHLPRFIDDAHAAAADLAHYLEVAETLGTCYAHASTPLPDGHGERLGPERLTRALTTTITLS